MAQSLPTAVGNDAPEISEVVVSGEEVVGIAAVEMMVRDSSSDLVAVRLEYDLLGDSPDAGFQTATAVRGTPTDVVVSPTGTPFTFVWDVVTDRGFTESDVLLRLTPGDGDLFGTPQEVVLTIDNNTAPTAILNAGHFLNNPDRTGGSPIAFTVFDGSVDTGEPADPVRLVSKGRDPHRTMAFAGWCPRRFGEARLGHGRFGATGPKRAVEEGAVWRGSQIRVRA